MVEKKAKTAEDKLMDAAVGLQGTTFSLVRVNGSVYVHVNTSDGYLVCKCVPQDDPINTIVNNFLADSYEQGRSESGLSPEQERLTWESDERPNDPDNPCDVCETRMPINVLTALFGCHYQCRNMDAANP